MNIKKIIKLKNNKYKIVFDDHEITTYDNVILDNNLLYKKNIDKENYDKIIKDTNYYDIYNKCVKSILKKRKSEKEIKEYLDKFNIDNKDKIISKLKEINLINDRDFTRAYINDKIYLSKCGINKIKNDLINLGIDIIIINEELSNIDKSIFQDLLEKQVLKKIKNNTKYSNYQLKQKILNEMINLGYEKEDILSIIDVNIISDNEILEKEFNKIYNKLKTKYSGYELNQKIKQKLTIKGFKVDDINKKIEEITYS